MRANVVTPVAWLVGALVLGAAVVSASPSQRDRRGPVYFEMAVARGQQIVSRPHAVVRIGADADISFPAGDPEAPRLGLSCRIEEAGDTGLIARMAVRVDGREVASQTLGLTCAQGASATFEGGGYTWSIKANCLTEEFLARRRRQEH